MNHPKQTSIYDLPGVEIKWADAPRKPPTQCATCGAALLPGETCLDHNGLHCRYCAHKITGQWPPDFTPAKHSDEIIDGMVGGDGPNRQALKGNWWERKGTPGAGPKDPAP